ncbi:hypothetical protein REJC140_00156 [Pseudorhizobium endolithicum]|uniref:Uncharacterized protein n=1 Tax=Pseudorhizobium endolithicum TaxID=1191678 RepID=A0ABM8PCR7_9HYPH|nr:hypothetical protein [Pseudorhizobium endolithicum]CAD7023289.1 hypothetical protein REJC140_00156 [Pseudorhizobium endolithicum]
MSRTDCATQVFGGCSCPPGHCRIEARRKEDEAKLRRIIAKRNADTALMMLGAVLSIMAFITSFILFAIPESKRLARVNQEIVHVQR